MAARKAKPKTLGGGVPEARAKLAVVKLDTQPKWPVLSHRMRQSHSRLCI